MTNNSHSKYSYIPSLDGMRAVAFFIVFLSHAGITMIPGGFGVTVFFFISGYLITTLLRREFELKRTISLKFFFIRRMLRIWPAFYLVLFVGAALTQLNLLEGKIILSAFLSQCLHYANYYSIYYGGAGQTAGSGVYWSLAVEEHFYLMLPLLYIFMLNMKVSAKNQMYVFLLLCVTTLLWRCALVYGFGVSEDRTYYASDTRFDSLLFGCALAVYGNPALDKQDWSEGKIKYLYFPLGVGLIIFSWVFRNPEFRETFRYTIQGIGLYPIFVAAIRYPDWGVFKLLNWKVMRFIGLLSYSLYLVHLTVIKALGMYWPQAQGILLGVGAFILSFVLAYLIYISIEVPFGRLRKKFKIA